MGIIMGVGKEALHASIHQFLHSIYPHNLDLVVAAVFAMFLVIISTVIAVAFLASFAPKVQSSFCAVFTATRKYFFALIAIIFFIFLDAFAANKRVAFCPPERSAPNPWAFSTMSEVEGRIVVARWFLEAR